MYVVPAVISTWAGNQTYMDILVKQTAVQNVTRVMKRENITYDIIIEDLQKRINEENPPLDENEIELQDRRGEFEITVIINILINFVTNKTRRDIPRVGVVLLQRELTIFGVTGPASDV